MTKEKAAELKSLLAEPIYQKLVEWFTLQLKDLKDIDNVRECSVAQDQAVELKAQKKAYQRVQGILETIIAIHDLPEETKAQDNDYGVDDVEK